MDYNKIPSVLPIPEEILMIIINNLRLPALPESV